MTGRSALTGGATTTGGVESTTDTTNFALSSVGIDASIYREFDNGSNPIVGLSAVTIEFWTKFTAKDYNGGNMATWWRCRGVCDPNRLAAIEINNRDCGGSFVEFKLIFESGSVHAVFGSCSVQPPDPSAVPYFPDGNWHHVAGAYDGSEMRLYVTET